MDMWQEIVQIRFEINGGYVPLKRKPYHAQRLSQSRLNRCTKNSPCVLMSSVIWSVAKFGKGWEKSAYNQYIMQI
jgi:hypothetical protein